MLLKSKKKTGGDHTFCKDNFNMNNIHLVKSLKIQSNVWCSFSDWSLIKSLKTSWLPPIFFFGYQEYLLRSTFSDSFKPRKNIPVLVSITDRKSEYLKMRRTYAQQQ